MRCKFCGKEVPSGAVDCIRRMLAFSDLLQLKLSSKSSVEQKFKEVEEEYHKRLVAESLNDDDDDELTALWEKYQIALFSWIYKDPMSAFYQREFRHVGTRMSLDYLAESGHFFQNDSPRDTSRKLALIATKF